MFDSYNFRFALPEAMACYTPNAPRHLQILTNRLDLFLPKNLNGFLSSILCEPPSSAGSVLLSEVDLPKE